MADVARKVKIVWDIRAFERVRRLDTVRRQLDAEVKEVLRDVTSGEFDDSDYAGGVEQGRSRLRGYVVTTSLASIHRESDEKALLRALGGGG